MFLPYNRWKFWTISIRFRFLENEKFSQKTGDRFLAGSNKIENASFHTKLPYQKPILVQNGHITKNGVAPVTTLFLKKFSLNLKTFYKKLIWCTINQNARIPSFCKRWSFIWLCFFPVSILKYGPSLVLNAISNVIIKFNLMAVLEISRNEITKIILKFCFHQHNLWWDHHHHQIANIVTNLETSHDRLFW